MQLKIFLFKNPYTHINLFFRNPFTVSQTCFGVPTPILLLKNIQGK